MSVSRRDVSVKMPPSHTQLQGRGQRGSVEVPGGVTHGRRLMTWSLPAAATCVFPAGEEGLPLCTLSDKETRPAPTPPTQGTPLVPCHQVLILSYCSDLLGLQASYCSERLSLSTTGFHGWRQNKGTFEIDKTATRAPNVRAQDEQHRHAPARPSQRSLGGQR